MRVRRSDPSESSFVRLAEAHRREGLVEDAIRICREGLTRFPTSLRGRILLGQILLDQGATGEGHGELDRVERESSGNPEILALLREVRVAVAPQRADDVGSLETAGPASRARPKPGTPRPTSRVSSSWIFPSTPDPPGCTRRMPRSTRWRVSTLAALYADQGDPVRAEAIRRRLEAGRPGGAPTEATPRTGEAPGTRYLDRLLRLRDVVQRLRTEYTRSA